ncbi:uncharacterized protein EV422DRAFT_531123 [Fimicolochytrium jonesii]|uniref:uncharacterized protein n=1 Tax=Fimicolochytrium jonesii TaxID=1396493 RepID=UPI0022FF0889|nr:uncharacterized protein EV422DRAFT_531123 [Fimicolochytrium jonesii]KAI8820510.1 hypothetical protein EV422DRAFT_531123 [Fimicolochytrium jonesii]
MHPLIRASLTSGVLFTGGDLLSQHIVPQPTAPSTVSTLSSLDDKNAPTTWRDVDIDWTRTSKFAILGAFLHGPYFLYGFRAIDRFWGPQPTLWNSIRKSATSQVTIFPPFVFLFLSSSALLDGQPPVDRLQKRFKEVIINGTLVWPAANVLGFRFVPAGWRLPYINFVGIFWNTYLSSITGSMARRNLEIPV